MKKRKVMIAGGGIGGLTAAHALHQSGHEVVVMERADDLRKIQVGGSIIVWTNAMRALEKLGLAAAVTTAGVPLERDLFYSWNGAYLGEWRVAEMGRRLGAPSIGLGRGELHRILHGTLPDGVVRLGADCTGFSQDENGVAARCADGREEQADLLIGADGVSSTIRGQLLGDMPPRYAGYSIWQSSVTTDLGRLGMSQMIFGPNARFVLAKFHHDQAHWFAVTGAAEEEEFDKSALLARYRDWMAPVEQIIAATDEKAIRKMKVVDRTPVSRWGAGRVTLLGDAAHPITWDLGQGAGQAMEDAIVLARCLEQNHDPMAALRAYEARRLPRTAMLAHQSRRIGQVASWKGAGSWRLRDLLFRISWKLGMHRMIEKFLMGYEA